MTFLPPDPADWKKGGSLARVTAATHTHEIVAMDGVLIYVRNLVPNATGATFESQAAGDAGLVALSDDLAGRTEG